MPEDEIFDPHPTVLEHPQCSWTEVRSAALADMYELRNVLPRHSLTWNDQNEVVTGVVPLLPIEVRRCFITDSDPLSPADIVEVVADYFGVGWEAVMSGRNCRICNARQVAMYLIRNERGLNFLKSTVFDKDHTTIQHAVKNITKRLKVDVDLERHIEHLKNTINYPNSKSSELKMVALTLEDLFFSLNCRPRSQKFYRLKQLVWIGTTGRRALPCGKRTAKRY